MTGKQTVHFIGVGGIGMSAVAQILLKLGYDVHGSDLVGNRETEKLKELGASIHQGHQAENLKEPETVVFSSAIRADNPEMVEAKRRGIPIFSRAEMLAELMRKKKSIVVAGAHGKTTTSAMITWMLLQAGFDPTAVIGGRLQPMGGNARIGTDEWFVAESDESDGSFLKMLPTIGVITNIDREHLDHYGSYEALQEAFVHFANRVPFDGTVIVSRENRGSAELLNRIEQKVVTFALDQEADIRGLDLRDRDGGTALVVSGKEFDSFEIFLPMAGRHNVLNALAAIAVGRNLGIETKTLQKAFASFEGIDRRLEHKGRVRGVAVLDDYAHHPTEIGFALEALRSLARQGSVRVLFQPHRFTRLRDHWEAFVSVFDGADEVVVLPIYAASERPIPEVTGEYLAHEISRRGKTSCSFVSSLAEGGRQLAQTARAGDVVVTMGAGSVTQAGSLLVEQLELSGKEGM